MDIAEMAEPSYVVLRSFDHPELDGKWYVDSGPRARILKVPMPSGGQLVFYVTDQFECRESDGAVAQVYRPEANPNGGGRVR